MFLNFRASHVLTPTKISVCWAVLHPELRGWTHKHFLMHLLCCCKLTSQFIHDGYIASKQLSNDDDDDDDDHDDDDHDDDDDDMNMNGDP